MSSRLLRLFLLLVALPLSAFAQRGLSVSLTTGGYRFQRGVDASTGTLAARPAAARVRVAAPGRVLPGQRGAGQSQWRRGPVQFSESAAAARHWTFRIFDTAGTQLWVSDDDTSAAQVTTPAALRAHAAWRRTVQVPLKIDGAWLTAGRYTVEASVAGDPGLGATAAFAVIDTAAPATTGIKGQVTVRSTPVATDTTLYTSYGVKAQLVITSAPEAAATGQAAFLWSGQTDDQGFFQVATPPGRYTVTASYPTRLVPLDSALVSPLTTYLPSTSTVTVVSGQFTVDDHVLKATTVINPPGWPFPADTGVTGRITETSADAAGLPVPLAGATVRLTTVYTGPIFRPVETDYLIIGHFPQTSSATTDAQGHYTVPSYAGLYRLTVYRNVLPGVYNATTSLPVITTTVTVKSGQFLTLDLNAPAPAATEAVPVALMNSLKVETAQTATIGSVPQSFLVATGTVTSGGWTLPALRPRPSTNARVLEYDLVAVPPSPLGGVTQALVSVTASVPFPGEGYYTIRVYSATNSKELNYALPLGTVTAQ